MAERWPNRELAKIKHGQAMPGPTSFSGMPCCYCATLMAAAHFCMYAMLSRASRSGPGV